MHDPPGVAGQLMAIGDSRVINFVPAGVTGSLDGNTARPGAMMATTNLIPVPDTAGLFAMRPAAFDIANGFLGFTAPGYVSLTFLQWPYVYGMVASNRFPGHDEPFAFAIETGTFITVSGVTGANTPLSPITTGAWTPPDADAVGKYITVTHPGFSGATYFVGWLDTSNPAAPVWSAGNTGSNALPGVPDSITSFFGRAYYGVGNVLYASDILDPKTMSNATYTLTIGGEDPIIATAPQPFFTTQSGGIVGALLAFKQDEIHQVTGDFAGTPSTIAQNKVTEGVGTLAPRSIAVTTKGVAFLADDGVRTVTLQGNVSDPNPDLITPFLAVPIPSRVAAAFSGGVYRIGGLFLQAGVAVQRDYWYDLTRKLWVGPHTLSYDNLIDLADNFLATSAVAPAQLQQTNIRPGPTDTYTENGAALSYVSNSTLLPEQAGTLEEKSVAETALFMAYLAPTTVTVELDDPTGAAISIPGGLSASVTLTTPLFGQIQPTNREIAWAGPVTFVRGAIKISGPSSNGLLLGPFFMRTISLGYSNWEDFPANTVPNPWDLGSVAVPATTFVDFGSVADAVTTSLDMGVL